MLEKQQMIERLVGVESSKINYYTELKNSINEMKKKNIQLEIINEVMKSFNVNMSMDILLKNVLEKLQHIFLLDRVSLLYLDEDELTVTNLYPESSSYVKLGTTIPREHSLYWQVIQEKTAKNYKINYDDNYIENRTFQVIRLRQVLIFPLFIKREVIGLFSVGSNQIIDYSEQDMNFLQQLSDHIAVSTENVRLYNEVLHVKNEWEKTFSAVVDFMFVVDLKGNLLRANEAAKNFFAKYDENNKSYKEIIFEGMKHSTIIEECINSKRPVSRELKFKEKYYYETFAYPVYHENEEVYSVILYMKDITKKREYEVQILQSGKLAAIGELAAGVAHELNNPLTAILGNAQLLMRKASTNDGTYHLLHDIYECGKRSKHIIQNLLTFSRQDEYLFEKFSINDAVRSVLSLIGYQFRQQQISLETYLNENIPLVEGNSQQMEQVIINLLINAKDALEDCDDPKIIISTYIQNDHIYLTVEDNGIGIKKELQHDIFHPFYTTKEVVKGTGLGLSVTLGIVESHGGQIAVESELHEGSTFIVTLPLANE